MAQATLPKHSTRVDQRSRRIRVVRAIDDLLNLYATGTPRSTLPARLQRLRELLIDYCRDTERVLADKGTPGLEAFVTVHARLLHEYDSHVRRLAGNCDASNAAFCEFLTRWLRMHILHAHPAASHRTCKPRVRQSPETPALR